MHCYLTSFIAKFRVSHFSVVSKTIQGEKNYIKHTKTLNIGHDVKQQKQQSFSSYLFPKAIYCT